MDLPMSFIWPAMLLSLLLVPLLVWLYLRMQQQRKQFAATYSSFGLVQEAAGRGPGVRRHIPPALFLIGLTLLLFALARPEMVVSLPRIEGTVILAFDVSNSMNADDLEPTRIEAAKVAARAFVENQPPTILIGVVAFSSGGLVVQPPTDDQLAVLATIDRLSPQGGTSLGQGIFSSLSAIAGEVIALGEDEDAESLDAEDVTEIGPIGHFPSAVVVLLSDGENTEAPDPLEIAQVAADAGVRIFPIGIGSPEGAVVEVDGFSIVTQLNEISLQQIADLTNGTYYNAEDEQALREIYDTIDLQLTVREEKMEVTAIVAGVSILFFLVGGTLSLFWFGRVP
jgi:Ca-activated chloride channel family protein